MKKKKGREREREREREIVTAGTTANAHKCTVHLYIAITSNSTSIVE